MVLVPVWELQCHRPQRHEGSGGSFRLDDLRGAPQNVSEHPNPATSEHLKTGHFG